MISEADKNEMCRMRRLGFTMIHKLVRYRPPGAGVQREKRPCEHCQWRMNKEDPVVCGICYREVFG